MYSNTLRVFLVGLRIDKKIEHVIESLNEKGIQHNVFNNVYMVVSEVAENNHGHNLILTDIDFIDKFEPDFFEFCSKYRNTTCCCISHTDFSAINTVKKASKNGAEIIANETQFLNKLDLFKN